MKVRLSRSAWFRAPMAMRSGIGRADLAMVAAMMTWGTSVTITKAAVGAVPALGFGLLRYTVAAAALLALLRRREGALGFERRYLPWMALTGVVGLGIYQICLLLGVGLLSAGVAAIILATSPLWTACVAALWADEPLGPRGMLALAVSFAGVVIVLGASSGGVRASLLGGALMAGAALAVALSAVLAKPSLRAYSPLRVTTWMCVFGCLTLLPGGVPAIASAPRLFVAAPVVLAVLYTGLCATILGNMAWNFAIQKLGATRAAGYTYLQPLFGVAIAAVALGERFTLVQVAGGAVVIMGLIIYPRPAIAA